MRLAVNSIEEKIVISFSIRKKKENVFGEIMDKKKHRY